MLLTVSFLFFLWLHLSASQLFYLFSIPLSTFDGRVKLHILIYAIGFKFREILVQAKVIFIVFAVIRGA